jgi:hypothetical protein
MQTLQNSYIKTAYTPAALASSSESLGAAIDLAQLGGLDTVVYLITTSSTAGAVTVAIKESATSGGSYAAITGATVTLAASTAGVAMISVKLGGPRLGFQKISFTAATTDSRVLSAVVIGTNPAQGVNGATEALRATNAGLLSRAVV